MIVLGIDPGSRKTGFGVLKTENGKFRVLAADTITLKQNSFIERISAIFHQIHRVILDYQPTVMAVEDVFVGKNPRSALKLGQARGVAIAVASSEGLPVYEYPTSCVKLALTGKGNAEKWQVQRMLQMLFRTDANLGEDAADALAVAFCHASTLPAKQR